MIFAPGTSVDERFQIIQPHAEGGTAHIYRAFDTKDQKQVALKVFVNPTIDEDLLSEIWARESQALGKLGQHDAIVSMVSAGRDPESNLRYIALEWLDGDTLEKELSIRGAISWEGFLAGYGASILEALCFAYEANIVHRDLSTKNIIVSKDRTLRLIDFGQAKLDQSVVGRTVAGWKTPPYCPPEEDTGRYSDTRDPYSFCAVAIRALAGTKIDDHEQLYSALKRVSAPAAVLRVLKCALSREPALRIANILDLHANLTNHPVDTQLPYVLPIRCAPVVQLPTLENREYDSPLGVVLAELNDAISISEQQKDDLKYRFRVETGSYRLIIDLDSQRPDHLVIVSLTEKHFSLDRLYNKSLWMPDVAFVTALPKSAGQRKTAQANIFRFYTDYEKFLADQPKSTLLSNSSFDEWGRLLDAMRHIERTREQPLRYSAPDVDGQRLTVRIQNLDDMAEGQSRFIRSEGRPVFSGAIESVDADGCTLWSNAWRIVPSEIPEKGILEIDWRQAKIALDRQLRALDQFVGNDIPNERIKQLISQPGSGNVARLFQQVPSFFDKRLDDEKKLIVSVFLATPDLLVVHGPPGTGKTTLIVEMIRQQLVLTPAAKILLVSQTHVAIDNVLAKLDGDDDALKPVRIGSGAKGLGDHVAHCSIDARGKQLKEQIESTTASYLKSKAKAANISLDEVSLGLTALALRAVAEQTSACAGTISELRQEIELRERALSKTPTVTERENKDRQLLHSLQQDLREMEGKREELYQTRRVTEEKLNGFGAQGSEIAKASESELSEWCELLLDETTSEIKTLMEISEDWRLKIGQSEDFRVMIIAVARVVAGTCVGFCREPAVRSSTFDLCIIDEASKATTTELLVPMAQAKKVVLVGDHHQLPAVIEHALTNLDIQEEFNLSPDTLETQLFEALIDGLPVGNRSELTVQYRMRHEIGSLISDCFYESKLKNAPSTVDRLCPNLSFAKLTNAVTWFDTDPMNQWSALEQRDGSSFVNQAEVDCVLAILTRLAFLAENKDPSVKGYTIGVISGYSSQVTALRREIKRQSALDILKIECNSVHAFQGQEVDICIYSVTRNNKEGNIGFLSDWRHLNVALSRARDYLVIVGGRQFCLNYANNSPFAPIIQKIDEESAYSMEQWEND